MATDEFGERTELPTERRRTQARERGNVPRSVDLTSAALLLGAATVFYVLAVPLCQRLTEVTITGLSTAVPTALTVGDVSQRIHGLLSLVAPRLVVILLAMMGVALVGNVIQVGILIAPQALQPQFSRLNPLAGARRLFSATAAMRLVGSLAKLALIAGIAAWSIQQVLPVFVNLMGLEPRVILFHVERSIVKLSFQLSFALVLLALADFLFQRWRFEQDLRMSKQEIREEMKEMEGDPYMRQRRREAHRKVTQARELQQVRTADVVVTNPTEIAVALKYDPEKVPAPIVVAKGMGVIAANIRRVAAENRVPIIERRELARSLYRTIKVGHPIPVEMYQVFVEIMAYVYRLTGRTPPTLG